MASSLFDVLATVVLFICACFAFSIIYSGLPEACAPPSAPSHPYIEPQVVLPSPLWPHDRPAPREPLEPTFEPRPEPEPLPQHRHNGLIPRAERRVRPTVSSGRPIQRERHMTEMSVRERVAAADREAAQERYLAQKEQDLYWRTKAFVYEVAKAERIQEATSRTGSSGVSADSAPANESSVHDIPSGANSATADGHSERQKLANTTKTTDGIGSTHATEDGHNERKKLNINPEVANYRGHTQATQIERPVGENSNALTGTALYNASMPAYASPMDVEPPVTTSQPLSGAAQDYDYTLAGNTSSAHDTTVTSNPLLAGGSRDGNDITVGGCSTTEETQIKNPLLDYVDEQAAAGLHEALKKLQGIKNADQVDDAWVDKVYWVYTSWYEWITCDNTLVWHFDKLNKEQIEHLGPMVDDTRAILEKRFGKRNVNHPKDALNDAHVAVMRVYENMSEAYRYLQSILSSSPATQDQQSANHNEFANMQQFASQEQFDNRQQQIASDAQLAQVLEQQELARVEQQIYSAQSQQTTFASGSNAAQADVQNNQAGLQSNMTVPVPALGDYINSEQFDPSSYAQFTSPSMATFATTQQHCVPPPALSAQQASVFNATIQQPTDAERNSSSDSTRPQFTFFGDQASQKSPADLQNPNTGTNDFQFVPNDAQKAHQVGANRAAFLEGRSADSGNNKALFVPDHIQKRWEYKDTHLEGGALPLQKEKISTDAALVLVTTWLRLNNELVNTHQKHFKTSMQQGPLFVHDIKLISARYRQLRQYVCVKRVQEEGYHWRTERISLNDITKNKLQQLISKDEEFLLRLKDDVSKQAESDEGRKIVMAAYDNVMAVDRSIKRITAPSGMFNTAKHTRNDSVSTRLSSPTPSVKAEIDKQDARLKASTPSTWPPGKGPNREV